MRVRPGFLAYTGLIAALALVPLYGDPRQSPVTHPEWARMVLRGLELEDALGPSTRASHVFSALSFRESLAYAAEEYLRADGMDLHERADGTRLLSVVDPIGGEAAYHMAVVRGGDYRVRVKAAGTSREPAHAEIVRRGASQPVGAPLPLPLPAEPEWVDLGARHLDPGVYYTSVLLPEGCDLEYVELAPPCVNPIEPIGGWRPTALTHVYDVAVTTLQALDMEYELPPASTPIEHGAEEFAIVGGEPVPLFAAAGDLVESHWLRGGADGRQALLRIDIPTNGLYTVYTFADTSGGQSWTADSCHKSVLCPSDEAPRWWPVLSNRFEAGPHTLAVTLGPGSVVQRVRVVRKKDSPEDYVAALERLGLDLGELGSITRSRAVDAMNFIEGKRAEVASAFCGEVVRRDRQTPGTLAGDPTGNVSGPGVTPPDSGQPLPPGGSPLGPPSDNGFPPGIEPPNVTQPPASPDVP